MHEISHQVQILYNPTLTDTSTTLPVSLCGLCPSLNTPHNVIPPLLDITAVQTFYWVVFCQRTVSLEQNTCIHNNMKSNKHMMAERLVTEIFILHPSQILLSAEQSQHVTMQIWLGRQFVASLVLYLSLMTIVSVLSNYHLILCNKVLSATAENSTREIKPETISMLTVPESSQAAYKVKETGSLSKHRLAC